MLFNIDVESRPSYDTIFQYLLKLNVSQVASKVVYKTPYRRARAWPSGCIVQPLGRVRARAKESCIQQVRGFGCDYE